MVSPVTPPPTTTTPLSVSLPIRRTVADVRPCARGRPGWEYSRHVCRVHDLRPGAATRPGLLAGGDFQVHRDFVDFVVDGRPLLYRLSDLDAVSPLASDVPPSLFTAQVRSLLLETGAPCPTAGTSSTAAPSARTSPAAP